MELKEITSVKGKAGLFRILKANELHAIIRPLDNINGNILTVPKYLLNILGDISIYTSTKDDAVPLKKVLQLMWKKYKDKLNADPNSNREDLKVFMKSILPQYDDERVYSSDIKKLIQWYPIVLKYSPETIKASDTDTTGKKVNAKKETDKKKTKNKSKKSSDKSHKHSAPSPSQKTLRVKKSSQAGRKKAP